MKTILKKAFHRKMSLSMSSVTPFLRRQSLLWLSAALFLPLYADEVESEKAFIRENMEFAVRQYELMMQQPTTGNGKNCMPRTMNSNGALSKTHIYEWTSGFFPGSLWYLYDFTRKEALADSARAYMQLLEPVKKYTGNHDVGFMMYCSYGNALRFAPRPEYKDILVESARSLCTRFRPQAGIIQSWNGFRSWHGEQTFKMPVIIDNMMNLELLFYAAKVTGDEKFRQIAISHADKTLENHLRKDYSCYHVVAYDDQTGRPIKGETAQGYSDNSTWSRGQAWGIYGFTMTYRETRDKRYLKAAEKAADFFIHHPNLPSDMIPWWDFNAYQKGYTPGVRSNARVFTANYRDASAAACVASALLELSGYVKAKKKQEYLQAAKTILHSLGSEAYRAPYKKNAYFVLMHSVGSIPHKAEIDVPLVYADYYFIEALYRYHRILSGQSAL